MAPPLLCVPCSGTLLLPLVARPASSAWMSIIDREGLNEAMRMFDDHVASRGRANYNLNVTYTHKEGHQVGPAAV